MATVTHYIYSHYDPAEREALELETGQAGGDTLDPDEAWRREAPRISQYKRAPPKFVSATIPIDEWGHPQPEISNPQASTSSLGSSVSGWYHSLTSARPEISSTLSLNSSSTPPLNQRKPETRDKNNWFILKAIESDSPSPFAPTPAPTLADILARDPPPLPSEGRYTPPAWLEIGPSNKGFGMLQRSGWNEGEPLGPGVIRRKAVDDDVEAALSASSNKGKGISRSISSTPASRKETMEIKIENFDDVSELREIDVIDLTLSDSDGDEAPGSGDEAGNKLEISSPSRDISSHLPKDAIQGHHISYERKALLTPIATVLKSDRLGIGLKAKTVGPYRASRKRVTHNAAALAAHVKAAAETRKRKTLFGRGHRGFEKQRRMEEENRKAMVAYLKGP